MVPKQSVGRKKQVDKVMTVIPAPKSPLKTKAPKTKAAVVVETTIRVPAAKQPRDDPDREDGLSTREKRLRQKEDYFEQRIREMESRMQAAHASTVLVKVASITYSAVSVHTAPDVSSEKKQPDMLLEMLISYTQPAASSNVSRNLLLMNIVAGNESE